MPSPPIDMIIAGAAKAGTTSLLRYLSQHPEICAPRESEMAFFRLDRQYDAGYEAAFDRYFGHCVSTKTIIAKNAGLMYSPVGLQRLSEHNPEIDIVLVLRDPIERAYSHFWFARQLGYEPLSSFEAALDAEPERMRSDPAKWDRCAYYFKSDYATHLETLFELFPAPQIVIVTTPELGNDPQSVCSSLFDRLEVSADYGIDLAERHNVTGEARWSSLSRAIQPRSRTARTARALLPQRLRLPLYWFLRKANKRRSQPPDIEPQTRRHLAVQFAPMMARLQDMTGRTMSGWDA